MCGQGSYPDGRSSVPAGCLMPPVVEVFAQVRGGFAGRNGSVAMGEARGQRYCIRCNNHRST